MHTYLHKKHTHVYNVCTCRYEEMREAEQKCHIFEEKFVWWEDAQYHAENALN